jgi:peptidoglycan/xylan/chitin deacetylase (PgdA/CDA1 family)
MRAEPRNPRARAKDALMRATTGLRLDAGARWLASARGAAPVRGMVLHGTPARLADAFAAQLRWVADRFVVLDPAEYLEILDGTRAAPRRPAVVFTFDDGLGSNASVGAPVLESFGFRGMFFVCPAFAETTGDAARTFFTSRIRPHPDPASLPADDFAPMSPAAMRALRRRGHLIGNHTRSHQHLGEVDAAAIDAEITGARDTLAAWLGEPVTTFAWTFAWDAIRAETWRAALATHRYCFTACPGRDALAAGCVWRTNVEPDLPAHTYPFFYSGLADPIWWTRRRRLAALHALAARPA